MTTLTSANDDLRDNAIKAAVCFSRFNFLVNLLTYDIMENLQILGASHRPHPCYPGLLSDLFFRE